MKVRKLVRISTAVSVLLLVFCFFAIRVSAQMETSGARQNRRGHPSDVAV